MLDGNVDVVGVAGNTLTEVRGDLGVFATEELMEFEDVEEALECE